MRTAVADSSDTDSWCTSGFHGDPSHVDRALSGVARLAKPFAQHGERFAIAVLFCSVGHFAGVVAYTPLMEKGHQEKALISSLIAMSFILHLSSGLLYRVKASSCTSALVCLFVGCCFVALTAAEVWWHATISGPKATAEPFVAYGLAMGPVFFVLCLRWWGNSAGSAMFDTGIAHARFVMPPDMDIPLERMEEVKEQWYETGKLTNVLNQVSHNRHRLMIRNPMNELHSRGALLNWFYYRLRRDHARLSAITSLWEKRWCHSRKKFLLSAPYFAVCVLFWFHVCWAIWEIAEITFDLLIWDKSFVFYGVVAVSSVVMIIVVDSVYQYHVLLTNDVENMRLRQWEDSTAGFCGLGQNVCVVSISGRSKTFWFGVKDACKQLGIGFACVWENDWGTKWWDLWKKNVYQYGVETGVSLVVLIDAELADAGQAGISPWCCRRACLRSRRDDRRATTMLGGAQQLEVAYLLETGQKFVRLTNEEFVYYLRQKSACDTLQCPEQKCIAPEADGGGN